MNNEQEKNLNSAVGSDYIAAAAQLWEATQRRKQLGRKIERLKDEVMAAGARVTQRYRDLPWNQDSERDPMTAVSMILQAREFEEWGVDLPDGLSRHDILTGTGLGCAEVDQGLDELQEMCDRGYDKLLLYKVVCGVPRWRLVHETEVQQ